MRDGILFGTPCADRIVVPENVSTVEGGAGDDVIVAPMSAADGSCPEGCHLGIGSQTFEGGPGNDVVYGERGNDILRGGEGNDRLYGGIGDDRLEGGSGDDLLSGGFGADGIDGGPGSDFVRGDATQDEIDDSGGSADIDTLSYATGATPGFPDNTAYPDFSAHAGFPGPGGERGVYLNLATDTADNGVAPDGGGVDVVDGSAFERIVGTPFSDYISGSKSGQSIYGGGGADVLIGSGGGVHLDGGADGDDCVGGATVAACESQAANGPVAPRQAGKVSVGLMAPGAGAEAEVYAVGSSAADTLTATYVPGPPASVVLDLSGAQFDQAAAGGAGCTATSAQATCAVAGPLDSLLLAGAGAGDRLQANGFPALTSVIELGGEGGDSLTGGQGEDVLADGPGDDTLDSRGGDDAVLNNEGADQIAGGTGNDLFLSDSICDGDVLNGGEGRDNASWAKFKSGIEARIGIGVAGRPGSGGGPDCAGGSLDRLEQIEDLEGTSSADGLYGGAESNQLLGHLGPDTYFAEAGDDTILANSGDFDPTIDCGEGTDVALIDFAQYGDVAAPNCETVQEAAPNSFRIEARLSPPLTSAPGATLPPAPPAAPPSNAFRLVGSLHDRSRGLVRLRIRVPGAGTLLARGPQVRPVRRRPARAGLVQLTIRPRPQLARAMRRGRGRARVAVVVAFTPLGGATRRRHLAVTLIRTPGRPPGLLQSDHQRKEVVLISSHMLEGTLEVQGR